MLLVLLIFFTALWRKSSGPTFVFKKLCFQLNLKISAKIKESGDLPFIQDLVFRYKMSYDLMKISKSQI